MHRLTLPVREANRHATHWAVATRSFVSLPSKVVNSTQSLYLERSEWCNFEIGFRLPHNLMPPHISFIVLCAAEVNSYRTAKEINEQNRLYAREQTVHVLNIWPLYLSQMEAHKTEMMDSNGVLCRPPLKANVITKRICIYRAFSKKHKIIVLGLTWVRNVRHRIAARKSLNWHKMKNEENKFDKISHTVGVHVRSISYPLHANEEWNSVWWALFCWRLCCVRWCLCESLAFA